MPIDERGAIPDGIVTMADWANYLAESGCEWFKYMLESGETDPDMKHVISSYLSVEIEINDEIPVDLCSRYHHNGGPQVMYKSTMVYSNGERIPVTHHGCWRCVGKDLMQAIADNTGNTYLFELWGNDSYRAVPAEFFPTNKITDCASCDSPMLDQNFSNNSRFKAIEAIADDEDVYLVHRSCARQCNECDAYHVAYNPWRRRSDSGPTGTKFVTVNGSEICPNCWNSNYNPDDYMQCDSCGNHCYEDDMRYSEVRGETLCDNCYSCEIECGECGDEYYEDDGHNCEEDSGRGFIHSYSYKPTAKFFGEAPYHMGMELEVESRGRYDVASGAEHVLDKLGSNRIYCKWDGSLQDGFEIVTHPHSLDEWHKLDWSFLDDLKSMGFRSWNTKTCGLHVHVSRSAFRGSSTLTSEAHQLRFLKFIYDNQRQSCRIAGRQSDYARWDDKGNLIAKVKEGVNSAGHYSAINTENYETIEIRIFKGSLRKERVLSAIEFVHAVVEYTRSLRIVPKNKPLSWSRFVAWLLNESNNYPNLITIIDESFDRDESLVSVED